MEGGRESEGERERERERIKEEGEREPHEQQENKGKTPKKGPKEVGENTQKPWRKNIDTCSWSEFEISLELCVCARARVCACSALTAGLLGRADSRPSSCLGFPS